MTDRRGRRSFGPRDAIHHGTLEEESRGVWASRSSRHRHASTLFIFNNRYRAARSYFVAIAANRGESGEKEKRHTSRRERIKSELARVVGGLIKSRITSPKIHIGFHNEVSKNTSARQVSIARRRGWADCNEVVARVAREIARSSIDR